MWKRIELEWKILILACALFIAFGWPVQQVFISRLNATLQQSIDPQLESILRSRLAAAQGSERQAIEDALLRSRQWAALLPLVLREQRQVIVGASVVLFTVLSLLALWTLKRLTRPLKRLAAAIDRIGRGERAAVAITAGGALGTIESAVATLQEELDALREHARVQGMEKAWHDIARVMAHEIKNPLTPIRLTLDRIEERAGAGQDIPAWFMAKSLSRINAQLDALERLVNQFHSFAREPEAHLRAVALGPAVRATAEGMAQQLCTKIEGDADIQADPHLLAQVLLNIWKNALEAKATEIRATVVHAAQGIELIVADNGPGIPESQIERVWLPYVSTKQGGTGLGLPIVKRLVETMGGRAMLRSRTGSVHHGVTVTLAFALAEEGDCAHDRADANLGCR